MNATHPSLSLQGCDTRPSPHRHIGRQYQMWETHGGASRAGWSRGGTNPVHTLTPFIPFTPFTLHPTKREQNEQNEHSEYYEQNERGRRTTPPQTTRLRLSAPRHFRSGSFGADRRPFEVKPGGWLSGLCTRLGASEQAKQGADSGLTASAGAAGPPFVVCSPSVRSGVSHSTFRLAKLRQHRGIRMSLSARIVRPQRFDRAMCRDPLPYVGIYPLLCDLRGLSVWVLGGSSCPFVGFSGARFRFLSVPVFVCILGR